LIDLHCHILPGIDDGPKTMDESLAMARAAASAGTKTIVATSHVSWEYRNDAAMMQRLVGELNARLRAAGVEIEVRSGAEIAMTIVEDLDKAELARLTLGGGPWLLLEPPFAQLVTGLDLIVADLQSRGYGVVLAHPERCPAFHRDRRILETLIAAGALASITAGSLVGRFGGPVRDFAEQLIRDDLAHDVASDAHGAAKRPPGMAAEVAHAGLGPLAGWLTHAVPAAILDGSAIPSRPLVALESKPTGGLAKLLRRASGR
jgi:protein-tyrosine phosphatase